ncbi:MAG: hypothetical protein A2Z30_02120 [Chloroflexi bacterium RBG_16_64_43]|nr:MAG: hypothetical protein A2Z30_02120 [Chloroflexi bacterium RBG_16_64_43]
MLVAVVAATLMTAFLLRVLSTHAWDPMAFVLRTPPDLPAGQTWGVGYDGRFAFAIAANPWGSTADLDQPELRYQRILYPLAVKVLSLGNPKIVPWMLVAVNLGASFVAAAALAYLLARRGVSPWLALVLILSLGFLLALRMDLLEPMALALSLWAWYALENRRLALGAVLLALGALAKEIAIVFTLSWVLAAWFGGRRRAALGVLVAAVLPFAAWLLAVRAWFGSSAEMLAKTHLGWVPFAGLRFLADSVSRGVVMIWVIAPAILFGYLAARDLVRGLREPRSADAWLVIGSASLISLLPQPSWVDPLAIIRFGLGLVAGVLLWSATYRPRLLPLATGLWALSGLLLFVIPRMV